MKTVKIYYNLKKISMTLCDMITNDTCRVRTGRVIEMQIKLLPQATCDDKYCSRVFFLLIIGKISYPS